MTSSSKHADTIRERFTATAEVFANSVRTTRAQQADHLADCAVDGLSGAAESVAIDVCCGPGTFTRPLARRVKRAVGVDLTPAMLEKARSEAAREGIANIQFVCADVTALPFADGAADIVSCGYAVHHMQEPSRAVAEMVRLLRPGGRLLLNDNIVDQGRNGQLQNAMERLRDPSHTSTLTLEQFHQLYRDAGLRMLREEFIDLWHDFDAWMRNAGRAPGDTAYLQVRGAMEQCMGHDTSGFQPRPADNPSGLTFMHRVALFVGEKAGGTHADSGTARK
jgi:ubiquinone/menaquinone biosynthesis C-methylase UbiE